MLPRLSVVMPVRNAAPYLDASIESILGQTFGDFELVVLDDASTDGSSERLRAWAKRDRRVRLVVSPTPLGLVGSSNRVVQEAQAPICARMDADDVSCPTRLEAEWQALQSTAGAVLVGTLWEGIDAEGRRVRPRDRWRLCRRSSFSPFTHGSIMFRRVVFETVGGYRPACEYWEDLDLYLRMAAHGRILVVPAPLYRYRYHAASALARESRLDNQRSVELMLRCLAARRAGQDYTPLLTAAAGGPESENLSVATLYWLAGHRLWAGHAPGVLGSLPQVGSRTPGSLWLGLLVLATLGSVAPRLLRFAMSGLVRGRDALAGLRIRNGQPIEWRFE
jgi:glycosyltransferase involved in cell wall biosynthesis